MLVLSRKFNERIVLQTSDGLVSIQVVQLRGNMVRLGVNAPSSVRVWREEVFKLLLNRGSDYGCIRKDENDDHDSPRPAA